MYSNYTSQFQNNIGMQVLGIYRCLLHVSCVNSEYYYFLHWNYKEWEKKANMSLLFNEVNLWIFKTMVMLFSFYFNLPHEFLKKAQQNKIKKTKQKTKKSNNNKHSFMYNSTIFALWTHDIPIGIRLQCTRL